MTNRYIHTFTNDVLGTSDATEVAQSIAAGDYSALEAAKAAIARIKAVEPKLHTLALETFDAGYLDAQRHNQGAFSGVPTVIKDNLDVQGLPTQQGATAFNAKPAKTTDPMAKQFLAQGFTLLGKTNLPEFGFNGTTEYQDGRSVKNPWHTDYSAGGSSGGSAALVAAGALPIAHGNDGGGSIRIPASACGLVGLKATRGRLVVSELAKKLPINMIADGVLTRSVRDTANFMAAAEEYYHNPEFPALGKVSEPSKKRLKIGVLTEAITRKPIDADTQAAIDSTVALLTDLGHEVVETRQPLPEHFIDGFLIYYGFMGFATHTFGKALFGWQFDPKKLDPLTHGLRAHFLQNMQDVTRSLALFRKASKLFNDHIHAFDVVLSPVTGVVAPKLGYLSPSVEYDELMDRLGHYASFTALHNTMGTPAISLPLHMTADNRPVGVQFAAAKGQEKRLLELAFELEEAKGFVSISQFG